MGQTGMTLADEPTYVLPEWEPPPPPRRHRLHVPRRLLAVLAVIVATLAGGYLALVTFHQERGLSVGAIRLSVSPGHRGALDLYVPLVDWGVRFEAIKLPARLRVDLRTVDRSAVVKVANGGTLDVHKVRVEGRTALASSRGPLGGVVPLCGLALGLLGGLGVAGGPARR